MNCKTRKNILLMTYFRRNSRENLSQISRETNIPVSTIFDRLHELEKGLIKKHTTLLDFRKLGFDIKINILFKLGKESREEFQEFLIQNDNVNSLFRVNNGFDYLIEAIFKDINDMQKFTDSLESFHIEAKQELFVLEDLKREGFLTSEIHAKMII